MKKRPNGRYQRKVKLGEKYVFFYSSEPNSRAAERDIERQIRNYTEKEAAGKTFAEVADEWSTDHFPTLEHNTLKQYRPALKDVTDQFGTQYIKDITSMQIDLYLKSYARKGYAQKTVKTHLLILNLVMKYAVINQYIKVNPCTYVTVPKNLPKTRREALTPTELDAVRDNIDAPFGFFAYFLLNTGLRKGEALALRYSDIDRDRKVIKITKTVEWIGNVPHLKDHPKTDAGIREVPLLDCIAEHMPKGKNGDLIFPNYKGDLISNANFTRLWDKYRAATGLAITPHQLRHAYATTLYDVGVDIKTAQYLLGHANSQTTMDVYTHLSQTRQTTAADMLNAYATKLNDTNAYGK